MEKAHKRLNTWQEAIENENKAKYKAANKHFETLNKQQDKYKY